MPIPNPVPPVKAKLKKVPKKVWIIGIGGGIVLYIVFRSHANNTTGDNADLADPTVTDSLSSPGGDVTPGVYPLGGGQGALPAVDLGTSVPNVDGIDGIGAIDDPAAGTSDLGSLTLNIVGVPVDAPDGSNSAPGTPTTSNNSKSVSTTVIKTLSDLPYATRQKIQKERASGNVDRFGRTPTERSAARANAGIRKQLDNRLQRQRAHRAGGGPTKRQHPKVAHGDPKRPRTRQSPAKHVTQGHVSHPKSTPNPPRKKRAKSKHRS